MGTRCQGIAALLLIWLGSSALAGECADEQVFLRGDWGEARFSIEVADDPKEQAQGLMHRESLPRSAGMLFVYEQPRRVGFWMKNTLIPLDMLFLDQSGTVTRIHENAIPHDERPIFGPDDTIAVLEVNGGIAALMGIETGSQMRHPSFAQDTAAWPC